LLLGKYIFFYGVGAKCGVSKLLLGQNRSLIVMRKTLVVSLFAAVWIVATILALLWGFTYNWPDNVHVDYGVPLSWATNTVSTQAGPANLWTVNIFNLLVDLVFWLGIMTMAVATLLYKLKP